MLSYRDVIQRAAMRDRLAGWGARASDWIGRARRRIAQGKRSDAVLVEFSEKELARLHDLAPSSGAAHIDVQTWDDLLLSSYHRSVAGGSSICSQQMLYRRLRHGMPPGDRQLHARRIQSFLEDEQLFADMEARFHRLRTCDTEIATLLFANGELQPVPAWWHKARWLPHLTVAGFGCTIIIHPFNTVALSALAGAALLLLTQFLVRIEFDHAISYWTDLMTSLRKLLQTANDLQRSNLPHTGELSGSLSPARHLGRALARLPLGEPFHSAREVLDWFWLGRERHYVHQRRFVAANAARCQEIFRACADLEADLKLAAHLRDSNGHCWAQRGVSQDVALAQARHPLLRLPLPLTVATEGKGLFISGQNGVGKSTMLRTIGINQVAANSFGFCYAASATLPELPIFSSMHNEDALLEGQSLYISELTRARRLLDAADSTGAAIYLIDEIFRGTNYLESVSAAAAFLNALSRHSLVFVSSHNLILSAILARRLNSVEIKRNEADRQLVLAQGILKETNGISLLTAHGFDERIEQDARQVHRWLSAYITSPQGGCPIMLNG